MDRKKFTYYNVLGCMLWVGMMLLAGHFLQQFVKNKFDYDLTEHLEIIVLIIVVVTTFPVIYKAMKAGKESAAN